MSALSNIRRHPHLAGTVDYLRHCGADDIEVSHKKRVRIGWRYRGARMSIVLPAANRKTDELANIGRQVVRRRYREAGVEVRA